VESLWVAAGAAVTEAAEAVVGAAADLADLAAEVLAVVDQVEAGSALIIDYSEHIWRKGKQSFPSLF